MGKEILRCAQDDSTDFGRQGKVQFGRIVLDSLNSHTVSP